ncbi:MAG TPA: sensor histidine kinase [Coleofasciculaceae cyanobacterium]|jgi:signal transduction histidine kinase
MSRPIKVRNHPFRFLLYLEWILLLITALSEAFPAPSYRVYRFPLVAILSVAGFGIMGLRMPTGKLVYKVLYTSLEIFLISLTAVGGGAAAGSGIRLLLLVGGGIRLFPFLYVVLVIRSCLIFQLPGRLVVTGLSFTLFLLSILHWVQNFSERPLRPLLRERLQFILTGYTLLFGLSLAFVLLLMNALLAERQSREKVAVANDQLRQYALRIEDQATLQERNRIARDIHDSLGHSLTALNLQLETALKLLSADPEKATKFLVQAKQLGSTALQDVRQSVSTLRSNPLQGRSLEDAIASLAEEFHRSTGISPECNIIPTHSIPPEVITTVYRIVQESLTNISKYANATKVKIQLQTFPTQLEVIIQDNGRGFNANQNTTGFGLQGMRERTLALGGEFEINSAPTQGCKITAKLPLPKL